MNKTIPTESGYYWRKNLKLNRLEIVEISVTQLGVDYLFNEYFIGTESSETWINPKPDDNILYSQKLIPPI